MQSRTPISRTSPQHTRRNRVLMAFVLLFLALQLLGTSAHKHTYTDSRSDCAACAVAHLPLGAAPPSATLVTPALPAGLILLPVPEQRILARVSYLIPPAQAPPAFLSTL